MKRRRHIESLRSSTPAIARDPSGCGLRPARPTRQRCHDRHSGELNSRSKPPNPTVGSPSSTAITSKSPTRLAMARFRKDRKSMVAAVVVVFYIIAGMIGSDPGRVGRPGPATAPTSTSSAPTRCRSATGGASAGATRSVSSRSVGRDVLSRIWLGITFSLVVSISASVIAVVIGVVLGIVSGFSGGWVDSIIGRVHRPDPRLPADAAPAGRLVGRPGGPDRDPRTSPTGRSPRACSSSWCSGSSAGPAPVA